MLTRSSVIFLLVAGGCWGGEETAVTARLKAELKEVFPYAAPPAAGKPLAPGGPRSSAYQADPLAEARREAGAKEARKLAPLHGNVARWADPGAGSSARAADGTLVVSGAATVIENARQERKDTVVATDPDVVVLPKIEVTAQRRTKLEAQIAEIEMQQRSAEKSAEPSLLDAILNPPFLNLGGASGGSAQRRTEVLNWVKILTVSLETAKTSEEKARLEANIAALKDIVRTWR